MSESPGKRGSPVNISASKQPTAHMSTALKHTDSNQSQINTST